MEHLQEQQREYAKFRIYPWTPIAISLHQLPPPQGKVKQKIINALLDIYDSWQKQLLDSKETFYLKIWLFEPNINESQIVCAIGEQLHFYDKTFHKPELTKEFNPKGYGHLSERLNQYKWDFHINEYALFESDYKEDKFDSREEFLIENKYFEKELKKPHRALEIVQGKYIENMYMIAIGTVWVGYKNHTK